MDDSEIYHGGEIEVQTRARGRHQAEQLADMILPFLPPAANGFVSHQRLAVVGSGDFEGDIWASALIAEPGFLTIPDESTLRIVPSIHEDDPLWGNVRRNSETGVLILDSASRRRLRINGKAQVTDVGLLVKPRQVYTNCTKYIQKRVPAENAQPDVRRSTRATALSHDQQAWIARADTFFLATQHPSEGADASHRGGMPGFVQAPNPSQIEWPDYAGNNMFQSLGNLTISPRAGLLFVDFEAGRTLQLSGAAEILWDPEYARKFAGAKRVLQFSVEQVIETEAAFSQRWKLLEYSPANPNRS
jgi:hypothetical protein